MHYLILPKFHMPTHIRAHQCLHLRSHFLSRRICFRLFYLHTSTPYTLARTKFTFYRFLLHACRRIKCSIRRIVLPEFWEDSSGSRDTRRGKRTINICIVSEGKRGFGDDGGQNGRSKDTRIYSVRVVSHSRFFIRSLNL